MNQVREKYVESEARKQHREKFNVSIFNASNELRDADEVANELSEVSISFIEANYEKDDDFFVGITLRSKLDDDSGDAQFCYAEQMREKGYSEDFVQNYMTKLRDRLKILSDEYHTNKK